MTEPKYYEYMKPVLVILSKEYKALTKQEIVDKIIVHLGLSEEVLNKRVPSGESRVRNRIGWALTYLAKAELVTRPKRGTYLITKEGIKFNNENSVITDKNLPKTDNMLHFIGEGECENKKDDTIISEDETPEEILDKEYKIISSKLEMELLDELLSLDPFRFEEVIVDVIVAMGYGGSRNEAISQVTRKTGDGGIDGIINDDRLGLEKIYLQAKRYKGSVGRPEVQSFVGALVGKHATKGIVITTGQFSKEAEEYVKTVREQIILIDGIRLVSLMIEFNVGIYVKQTYEIKSINSDYFE